MAKSFSTRWGLLAILLVAAAFRFRGLDWDHQIAAHPDERYVVDVASRLTFASGLNPFDVEPNFAYGHLPVYLLAVAAALAPNVDPLLLGRALSASFDVMTVALTFALARRLYGTQAGQLAAAVVAVTVGHVQQAHFYTADPLLASLAVSTLFFAVRFVQDGRPLDVCLAGASAGLALGAKATAALLVIPLGVACSVAPAERRSAVWRCGVAATLALVVVEPFALVQLPTFLRNVAMQGVILRGAFDVPYTRQYHRTLPYVYPLVQQLRWGMGWIAGSCAFAGLIYSVTRTLRRDARPEAWVVWTWVVPYFGFVGGLYAKFPRYLLPVVPLLATYAAYLVVEAAPGRRRLRLVLSILLLAGPVLRCVSLSAMYSAPHPWVQASNWVYGHAKQGATIVVEAWDHPLPLDARAYELMELPIYDEDTTEKWETIEGALGEADYVIIASRRGYASLTRWPSRYGRTTRYYEHLFEGELGFRPVACFGRYPQLGNYVLADDPTAELDFSLPEPCVFGSERMLRLGRLDESFVVYDHPQAIIFRAAR